VVVLVWKYDVPIVAACLLNVRVALRAVNALTAYGRDVVARGVVRQLPETSSIQYRTFLTVRNGPG
jgi:hypothetical protein